MLIVEAWSDLYLSYLRRGSIWVLIHGFIHQAVEPGHRVILKHYSYDSQVELLQPIFIAF